MTVKKIFIFILLFILTQLLYSQQKSLWGINLIYSLPNNNSNENLNEKPSVNIGFFYEPLNPDNKSIFGASMGINYILKRTEASAWISTEGTVMKEYSNSTIHYLTFPVSAKFTLQNGSSSPYFRAGLELMTLIKITSNKKYIINNYRFEKINIGLIFGSGIDFSGSNSKLYRLEVLYKQSFGAYNTGSCSVMKWGFQSIELSFGVGFIR